MTDYDDPYRISGRYLDIMIRTWWDHHAQTVAAALRELPPGSGPVVDAGAGGGQGTRLIARTLPATPVLAVEPSPVLAAVLLSRVADDPGLRERVTVDTDDLLAAHLPERIGGMVMANLIGHFGPHERDRLWEDLAPRLAPGAFVLLNLPAPTEPRPVEQSPMSEVRVGERAYVGWARAEPAGPERLTWHMTYQTRHGDRVLSSDEVHYDWWTVSETALRAETAPHGLTATPHGPAEAGLYKILRQG
ncbi:class I SAM-dependent methyltransferase [Nocardiopsis changdeensis]|uniref:Class I SAM-dependent methyltransferase n=1 Tax=Nocardiopsis changdeensis TaxID=2831969 RepID=A0ABX8BSU0_9ACTN|nr:MULTISPECIES: class I SAM-dependent methyltransferase [Nocardiopsis]QUX25077.1 class I SAM-dependent methyltransferase [Nocardiopsis changdeensis]QYX35463.1 class I SAM-dependent methyltransferase [Nocardiopsis sp. MT53]